MAKSNDILNTTFRNATDINNFFINLGFKGFVDYWNTKHSRNGYFGNQIDSSGRIRHSRGPISSEKRWQDVWNNIQMSFNKSEVNLVEFLCINSIVLNESPSFRPSTEYFGRKGYKGISYTYSKIPGTKRSYNTLTDAGNKSSYDLFNDQVYINEHGHLPFASRYKNTNDINWKTGNIFPPGNNSKETSGKVSFLTEADFHKYRGRGFIQLTGRANYVKIIKIILNYSGDNSVIKRIRTKWIGKVGSNVDKIATISTNKDWDDLFKKTNNIIANASLWAHAQRTKYSWITPTDNEHKLENDIRTVARRIAGNGAKGYHDLFVGRVYQQINDILGVDNVIPTSQNTEGANDSSNVVSSDGGQPERHDTNDNNNTNSSNGPQLPKVEGLTNFFKPTSVVPKAIKFDAGRSKPHANEIKDTIGYLPFISYNGIQIEPRYVQSFSLSVSELLPMVKIVFEDQYGFMNDRATPMDDSKITIFISSRSTALKSLFMEFKISSFTNTGNTYVLSGVSNINGMFLRKYESYSNMSSFECLQKFAKRNGLGFNSNVNDSGDKMTWINPGIRGYEFIKDVISKSYRNDSSFIWCYIDTYYNLNYIDVEEAFKIDISTSIGIHTIGLNNIKDVKDDNKVIDLLLTNDKSMSDSNHYFDSWRLINNSTSISLDKGYLNKVKFYDISDLDFLIFDVDSITSEGDKTIIMKSAPQDNNYFKEHVTSTYVGKLDKDNMHKNYNYSIVQNKQNIDDIQKLGIRINMPSPNFNLYRFQKISIILTNKGSTPTHGLINKRLTGAWLIIDIKYMQIDGKFSQIVTLVKREMELTPDELSNEKSTSTPPSDTSENTDNPVENTVNPDVPTQTDNTSVNNILKWKWDLLWSNSGDIENFFSQYNNNGFVGWFNTEFSNNTLFGNDKNIIDKSKWTKVWNSISIMYNDVRSGNTKTPSKLKVNAIEFLAMNTLLHMLVGSNYKPTVDGSNIIDSFKSNNRKLYNSTAFDTFNNNYYNFTFTNQPFYTILHDTTDNRWKSNVLPTGFSSTGIVTETNINNNGYITNADFYKFRRRGYLPMIGRKEYLNIIKLLSNYIGNDNTLIEVNDKWDKSLQLSNIRDDEKDNAKAYISQNEDWDKIMLDNNINQGVIASISNYFYERNKEHVFNSNRSEDKVLKSIQNIGKSIKKNIPDFDVDNYTQRVKTQIELLDKK